MAKIGNYLQRANSKFLPGHFFFVIYNGHVMVLLRTGQAIEEESVNKTAISKHLLLDMVYVY